MYKKYRDNGKDGQTHRENELHKGRRKDRHTEGMKDRKEEGRTDTQRE